MKGLPNTAPPRSVLLAAWCCLAVSIGPTTTAALTLTQTTASLRECPTYAEYEYFRTEINKVWRFGGEIKSVIRDFANTHVEADDCCLHFRNRLQFYNAEFCPGWSVCPECCLLNAWSRCNSESPRHCPEHPQGCCAGPHPEYHAKCGFTDFKD